MRFASHAKDVIHRSRTSPPVELAGSRDTDRNCTAPAAVTHAVENSGRRHVLAWECGGVGLTNIPSRSALGRTYGRDRRLPYNRNLSRKQVKLITDGSCIGNPGPGGWAAILRYGDHKKELSGGEPRTTNNRMEMTAVIEGLRALREPCEVSIELDSQYVKDGITRWIRNWSRRNWKTASGDLVKNKDLWQEILSVMTGHSVTWVWVKGHANHRDNNRCDQIAKAAARSQSGNQPEGESTNMDRTRAARPE